MTRGVRSGGGKSKKLNRVFKTFIKRVKENLCTTLYRHGWRYMFFEMYVFRHKTKHMAFIVGIPLLGLAPFGVCLLCLQG